MRDLCEEFIVAGISPLSRGWATRDLEQDPTTGETRLKNLEESGTLFEAFYSLLPYTVSGVTVCFDT